MLAKGTLAVLHRLYFLLVAYRRGNLVHKMSVFVLFSLDDPLRNGTFTYRCIRELFHRPARQRYATAAPYRTASAVFSRQKAFSTTHSLILLSWTENSSRKGI